MGFRLSWKSILSEATPTEALPIAGLALLKAGLSQLWLQFHFIVNIAEALGRKLSPSPVQPGSSLVSLAGQSGT